MGCVENPTVFVVEDEPDIRDRFAALFSSMNLAVVTFTSGEEFIQGLDAGRLGCAVTDFGLKGMNGIELHHRLVEAGNELPMILVGAFLTVRIAVEAMKQGVFRVLERPCRNDELAGAVQDAIHYNSATRKQKQYQLDLKQRLESLDGREHRMLNLILAGHPNKTIERRLNLSRRTVERVRSSILAKTKFLSFMELSVAYGGLYGLLCQGPFCSAQLRYAPQNAPPTPLLLEGSSNCHSREGVVVAEQSGLGV